jgi:hypothetical protein
MACAGRGPARFAQDATSEDDLLIPVRVRPCDWKGLLAQTIYLDLIDDDEEAARRKLLHRVQGTETRLPSLAATVRQCHSFTNKLASPRRERLRSWNRRLAIRVDAEGNLPGCRAHREQLFIVCSPTGRVRLPALPNIPGNIPAEERPKRRRAATSLPTLLVSPARYDDGERGFSIFGRASDQDQAARSAAREAAIAFRRSPHRTCARASRFALIPYSVRDGVAANSERHCRLMSRAGGVVTSVTFAPLPTRMRALLRSANRSAESRQIAKPTMRCASLLCGSRTGTARAEGGTIAPHPSLPCIVGGVPTAARRPRLFAP